MKKCSYLLAALLLGVLFSCKNTRHKDSASPKASTADSTQAISPSITLAKLTDYPAYKNVVLHLLKPESSTLQPGEVTFKFALDDMTLGIPTPGAKKMELANSDKGQHLHIIIDDQPYRASYQRSFEKKLTKGTHILVAFPARSYHMSVKNKKAVVAKKFTVGHPKKDQYKNVDLAKPTLIYSRPKGTYKGEDTKRVLLDFYLLNTKLSPKGNKLRVTIDGQTFLIDEWAPFAMEGLPMGKNTIKLELLDRHGKRLPGSFNTVERTFTLKK